MRGFSIFEGISESVIDSFTDHTSRIVVTEPTTFKLNSGEVLIVIKGSVELSIEGLFGKLCELGPGEIVGLVEASLKEKMICSCKSKYRGTVVLSVTFEVVQAIMQKLKVYFERNGLLAKWMKTSIDRLMEFRERSLKGINAEQRLNSQPSECTAFEKPEWDRKKTILKNLKSWKGQQKERLQNLQGGKGSDLASKEYGIGSVIRENDETRILAKKIDYLLRKKLDSSQTVAERLPRRLLFEYLLAYSELQSQTLRANILDGPQSTVHSNKKTSGDKMRMLKTLFLTEASNNSDASSLKVMETSPQILTRRIRIMSRKPSPRARSND